MVQLLQETIFLPDEGATTNLGNALAPVLDAGDVILLNGAVGAGKSHLARSIIQSRLGYREDVPSPTYTLVQTYADGDCEIFHADLYRLGDASELVELGLDEALQNAICLVEWAERLGPEHLPPETLTITLSEKDDGRLATFSSDAVRWGKVRRAIDKAMFLIEAEWSGAQSSSVAGDLSSRTYQRLRLGKRSAIYMDAGDDVTSTIRFVEVAQWLAANGYSAPQPLAQATDKGLLLLDDFGDQRLAALPDVTQKMDLCLSLLADIRTKAPADLPCPTPGELAEMSMLATHYPGTDPEALRAVCDVLCGCLRTVNKGVTATVSLRDFHADNIMWLPEKDGLKRLGLLDFQDAFLVHPVYDLVS